MRMIVAAVAVFVVSGIVGAQAPPKQEPYANVNQLMRGIYYPNSNLLFEVQTKDPATIGKKEAAPGAASSASDLYAGWEAVENSALTLAESANLLTIPGRMCENGRPAPIDAANWVKYNAELRDASLAMYKAARSKNQEQASDATNGVAGACENCHIEYRDNPDRARCAP